MSNDYYNATTLLSRLSLARSAQVNSILEAIASGFDLLPGKDELNQNRVTYAEATGSANTYAISLTPAPASYAAGLQVRVKINATNTGATTLNVNGLGARSVKLLNGTDVAPADLTAGDIHEFVYSGSAFVMTTPSRALMAYQTPAVAGFGWGQTSTAPMLGNMNATSTASGAYRYDATTTGTKPSGASTAGTVIVQRSGEGILSQTLVGVDGSSYVRTYSGSWGAWRMLYGQGNAIGTVSQSGGVPTGAIFERGSNANGSYIRYACGTQICWIYNFYNLSITAGSYVEATWTYPAAFSATPGGTASWDTPGTASFIGPALVAGAGISARFNTANSGVVLAPGTGTDRVMRGNLVAIGSWF